MAVLVSSHTQLLSRPRGQDKATIVLTVIVVGVVIRATSNGTTASWGRLSRSRSRPSPRPLGFPVYHLVRIRSRHLEGIRINYSYRFQTSSFTASLTISSLYNRSQCLKKSRI